MTDDCVSVLRLAEEMAEAVRGGRFEEGFIVCREKDGKTVKQGSLCMGNDECVITLPACPTGKPFASFHTHVTHDLVGKAAQAMLVPSPKDIEADRTAQVEVGCIGGKLNDGTGIVSCFPTDRDAGVAKDIVNRMNDALERHPFTIERHLSELLDEYYDRLGKPCSVVRFRL